ncbi:MAG: radical SAM protein [Spirochaetia bacterium]|nr:radical SAM protein [Spirochaetia bacterium]
MYIFGPVPSRRLGLSLGVDPLLSKSCNLNCIYCELGRSFKLVTERKLFVPTADIVKEIKEFLDKGGETDFITVSGSGEPTLALNLGELITAIRAITDKKIAVITNGVLLSDPQVRRELCLADVVLPSMDSFTKETYIKINRPHGSINIEKVTEGLRAFAQEFKGGIWLEIMIVKGINDNDEEMKRAKEVLDTIPGIKSIQLNTVVRSRAESYAEPVSDETLKRLASILGPRAEVIGKFRNGVIHTIDSVESAILDALKRRPMTAQEFEQSMGMKRQQVEHSLQKLMERGEVERDDFNGKEFFKIKL